MMLTCLIIDDEQPARDLLENYVSRVPFLKLLGKCRNPLEALTIMRDEEVDLLLLDIQMPELKGTDFLRTLPTKPAVIFTTAYSEYALEGYQLEVSDYLLKPFPFERFLQAVNKVAKERALSQRTEESTEAPLGDAKEFLHVKADHRTYRLKVSDLRYIEGLREYVTFHSEGSKLVALETLRNLERRLPEGQFLRIHKSFIVNCSHVSSLYGNQLDLNGTLVPIGKSYRTKVLHHLFDGKG